MKKILIITSSVILLGICLFFMNSKQSGDFPLTTPTEQEIGEIAVRLDPILSMFHKDYDCEKDNIYNYLFCYDHLDYVYPNYDKEVKEYISEPLTVTEHGVSLWQQTAIPQNDPLGKFPKIPDEAYDEHGNVSEDLAWSLLESQGVYYRNVIIGHNKFSGEYLDWLIRDVWNGKVNHTDFMEFEDETRLYYHDGFYFTPECVGDRGGGIMYTPVIDRITLLDNNKYQLDYHIVDLNDEFYSRSKAVIGLKETGGGFRFWSVFSIDFDVE